MHDPGEMIKKISELEKNLQGSNRPEVLYARAQLLMAETMGKLLYVFIDISKKLDRAIDLMAYPPPQIMQKPEGAVELKLPGTIVPDDDRVDAEFVNIEDKTVDTDTETSTEDDTKDDESIEGLDTFKE